MKKNKFKEVVIMNNWKLPYFQKRKNRTLFGISIFHFDSYQFEIILSGFGFDIRFWFEKIREK